jgi:hypothetical protein
VIKRMIGRVVERAKRVHMRTLLVIASVATIVALGFMVWSLLVPTPMPVMLAMSVGQALGTLAFGLYLTAIVIDLRRGRRARRDSARSLELEAKAALVRDREASK